MTTRRGAFKPEPFSGTHAPAGPSPEALRKMGLSVDDDDDDDGAREEEAPTPTRTRARDAASKPARAERPEPGRGRPAKDERVQRSIRLTSPLDAKLRELAEARGIDINAAVSVAIAEDWRRSFGPYQGRA